MEAVLNAEVVLASKVVSALKVVVADITGVDEDCDMSAVLVNVKSVVTVLRTELAVPASELVVPKSVDDVVAPITEIVLLVDADVSAVVVAMLEDETGSQFLQSYLCWSNRTLNWEPE